MSAEILAAPASTPHETDEPDELDLDITITEADEGLDAWMCGGKSTDNGCDTLKNGDC